VSVTGPPAKGGQALPPRQLPRLLQPGAPLPLAGHVSRYGPVPFRRSGAELIAEVRRAGLAGRGGAGFPAGRKMHAVAAATAGRKPGLLHTARGSVVVANGVESEPASSKDKMLLGRSPHLVLDGIALAAAAVGASRAYLCLHDGHPGLTSLLRAAVTERERAGVNRVPIQVTEVPGGYVASQETALISFLNGGPQRPAFVPPRPFERGVHGRPTLVQNVETLAHLALIARYGAAWFRGLGVPQSAGSALITVSGAVCEPSVLEIELGTRIGDLIERAGGPAEPPQAVLAGGYFGGWLPYPAALNVRMTDAGLRGAGAALGPGVLVLLPASACGLAETARTIWYLASQSAGQCGPCLNGLPALATAFDEVAFARPGRDTQGWARQLLALVAGRGACHLPDGTAALAASALRVFGHDLRRHAASGPCPRAWRAPVLPEPVLPEPGGQDPTP
jgi:NADH:ubiquinone oxidoreductase subunit F (NADH-binding)